MIGAASNDSHRKRLPHSPWAVGATDYGSGTPLRAPYSNYRPGINVVAPGGNAAVDSDGDGHVDGVLSTTWDFVSKTRICSSPLCYTS